MSEEPLSRRSIRRRRSVSWSPSAGSSPATPSAAAALDDDAALGLIESHLRVRVPEGAPLDARRDELFKAVYRTSLLQLLVDRGNYSDRATEREAKARLSFTDGAALRRPSETPRLRAISSPLASPAARANGVHGAAGELSLIHI